MCVDNIIHNIRNGILRIIPPERGVFNTDIPDGRWAGTQGIAKESWIYRKHEVGYNIIIVLQYLVEGADGAPGVEIAGDTFSPIRLVIYDEEPVPAGVANKNELGNRLLNQAGVANNNQFQVPNQQFRNVIGHVVDLPIVVPGGQNLNLNDPNDRNAFIIEVAAALNTLMPVADYYVRNRERLFQQR